MDIRNYLLYPEEATDYMFIGKLRVHRSIPDAPPADVIRNDLPPPKKEFSGFEEPIELFGKDLKSEVEGILSKLTEVERPVIVLLMGLGDGIGRTRAEIAKELGMSIGEVERIEKEVWKRLKNM